MALATCATPLAAQRAHQLEIGGYGSVIRYDHLMSLRWRVGAGARLGYFLSNGLALEIEGGLAQPRTQTPLVFTTARWASASVVLNVRAGRNAPYLLGGYTRIVYGGANDAPYNFGDHAIHGAIGDRITLIEGVALRLEGRAIFAPRTDSRFGGSWAGHVVGSFGLSMFALGRRAGDADRGHARASVVDSLDCCASTTRGAQVDPSGCPLDADGDGVADALDRCASTARGIAVDAAGCPVASADMSRLFGVMRGVGFEAGGSALTAGSYAGLNDIAAALIAHPDVRVEIAVYTDDAGVPGTIVRLTQLRAEVVRSYLAGRGVASTAAWSCTGCREGIATTSHTVRGW